MSRAAALILSVALLHAAGSPAQAPEQRRLTIPAAQSGQPALDIRVSAEGPRGLVDVRSADGRTLQTLTCALLPPNSSAAVIFVSQFEAVDLDMDGAPDLRGVRDFGTKWARHCVWIFDPVSRRFETTRLAEQMELLSNLEVDAAHHRLIESFIGPVRPMRYVYRIVGDYGELNLRQLLLEHSCLFDSDMSGFTTVFVTQYAHGRATTKRHRLPPGDHRTRQAICDAFVGVG